MFEKLIDKLDKQDGNMKALLEKQDTEIDKKTDIQLQPLKIQVKDNSEAISTMKVSYVERLEKSATIIKPLSNLTQQGKKSKSYSIISLTN